MKEDIRKVVEEILPEVAAEGMQYFQKAIAEKKIIFSEELLHDFELTIQKEAEAMAATISFNAYGRFKDMKGIRWNGSHPNFDALKIWVAKIGINNFAWIPGYEKTGHVPAEDVAIRRLARQIMYALSSVPITKKKYSGTWYNETKMKMVNVARRRILEKATQLVADNVKKELENQ